MRTSDLEYELPPERIARQPTDRRDASRLLVLDRATGQRRHETFDRLATLLPPRSLLVLNNTRVLPARLLMRRLTGGHTEGLFLHELNNGLWEIMLTGSARLKSGEELAIEGSTRRLRLCERLKNGTWRAEPMPAGSALDVLAECGHPPLPPYIRNARRTKPLADLSDDCLETFDVERYQTIYACQPGAVAAPTAGLHFTPAVFDDLRSADMETVFVTLHVGMGTFLPIRCDDLAAHNMHAEWYDCPAATASAINTARGQGRPIVAVGTTSVRVLETCANESGQVAPGSGETRLFIYPPYRYRVVDKLLTNFHLPGSTLLAMIFAFADRETILAAYNEAIAKEYRFYSYGDAMLIL